METEIIISGNAYQTKVKKDTFLSIVKERRVLVNLMVMTWISTTVAINYYLISYLAVTFDRPYMQVAFSTLAEILAYATSGILFKWLGSKVSLLITFLISAIGGFAIY